MSFISGIDEGTVKRKTKTLCHWCGEGFAVGDAFCCWSGVNDGGWFSVKMHAECYEALRREEDLENADFDDGIELHQRKRGMTHEESEEEEGE